jgi:outer membrane protein TolC
VRTVFILLMTVGSGWASQLDELVREALARNPEIQAAEKRWEAARQRPSQESSMPDPMVSVGYASNGGPLPGQGLGTNPTSNVGVMVSQELPAAGKRKLRGDIARKEADVEYEKFQAAQLGVRSRVTQAYHRLHHAYAAGEILERGKQLVSDVIRVSEARYAAGQAAQQDILKAQVQLSLLEARIVQVGQDRATAEAELNALLNRTPSTPVARPGDLDPPPLTFTAEELLAKAARIAPDLLREQDLIERGRLAIDLARRDFKSDYKVSAGYYNMMGMPSMYEFRLDVPVHLHTAHKQAPAVGEQILRLGEARQNFEAANQSLQFRVRESYAAAQTAWRLIKLYSDTILPQSALTIESSLASYETGGTDFLSVLTNVMAKVDAEDRYHEQKMMYALALARLEELTGVPIGGAQ